MKKITTLAAIAFSFTVGASAQTIYDGAKIGSKDLNGTARFIGMGGAMGALGGDISTMGTNPAGIGIYRSNDIMTTFNFSTTTTKSNFLGTSVSSDADKFMFNNLGVVLSTKIGNQTSLRYVNFGFNYGRSKSFYKNMSMSGLLNDGPGNAWLSQMNQIEAQANNAGQDLDRNNIYRNDYAGWLSAMAYQGYLLEKLPNSNSQYEAALPPVLDPVEAFYDASERGGVDQYDFNVSFNFNDRVYLGATIGAYDVSYRKFADYEENYGDAWHRIESWNTIDGSGFDFKLGAIVRPFEQSPFRIGFAIHTPIFYNLTQYNSARLTNDALEGAIDTYVEYGGDMIREFKLRTPWLFNVSLGYTIGTQIALGFEYEYEDYSSMKFRFPHIGSSSWETETAKEMMRGVSTARLGIEYKPFPEFAIRGGYNISSAAFKNSAWKNLPVNSVNTDTDYANTKAISNYTLGLGYRGTNFYADLAYKYNHYKEDFYPFEELYLEPTKVTNNTHQVYLTLGFKF